MAQTRSTTTSPATPVATPVDDDHIPNATAIIAKFGGIRPMAGKMNVPVTTVQGWKKRDVIPAVRRDDILNAAKAHKIGGVEQLVDGANENAQAASKAPAKVASKAKASSRIPAKAPAKTAAKVTAKPVAKKPAKTTKETAARPVSNKTAAKIQDKGTAMSQDPSKPVTPAQSVVTRSAESKPAVSATPKAGAPAAKPSASPAAKAAAAKPAGKPAASKTAATSKPASTAPNAMPSHDPHATAQQRTAATEAYLKDMGRRSMKRSMMLSGSLLAIALVIGFLMFSGDDVKQIENDLSKVQNNVSTLENRTAMLENALPANLTENLQTLKQDAQLLKDTVGTLADDMRSAAATLGDAANGSIVDRIALLETQVGEMGSGQSLTQLMHRLDSLSQSMNGQQQLSEAMGELSHVVQGLQGQMDDFDVALEKARAENEDLARTLDGVTGRDLGAAAMLLALGQFRSSVNRNAPFEEDLAILRKIVGDEDPELNAALDRLAPYAASGVLTPEGLKDELKTLSGDIVMARLSGEDVSVRDKALTRLGEFISVTKDGEPLTATPEEAAIARAQTLLDEGDVQGAMEVLNTLEGPAKDAAAPWMEKAEGHVAAQNAEELILQTVLQYLSGGDTDGLLRGAKNLPGLGDAMQSIPGMPQNGAQGAPQGVPQGGGLTRPSGSVQSDPNSGINIYNKNAGTPWPMGQ